MKNFRTIVFGLFLLACAAGPHVIDAARAAIWQWSGTASNNASADPSINWAEGMSPSSVNDSARAMMARIAEWRSDLAGGTATGGPVAYALTTLEGLPNPPLGGTLIGVVIGQTNGANPTLSTDGGTAFPIVVALTGGAIPAGTFLANGQYRLRFTANTGGAWVAEAIYNQPGAVPLGAMVDFTGDTSPNSSFVIPAGQCISRTTYAAYFTIAGTRFGACDGTTTFAVPDVRGRIMATIDNLGGTPAGRITTVGCGGLAFNSVGVVCGSQTATLTSTAQLPPYVPSGSISNGAITSTVSNGIYGAKSLPGIFAGGSPTQMMTDPGVIIVTSTQAASAFSGAGVGSSSPFPVLPPVMAISKLLRVL